MTASISKSELKGQFDSAQQTITDTILGSCPQPQGGKGRPAQEDEQEEEQVDLTEAYDLSRLTLGDYVTLDWAHREDIVSLEESIATYRADPTLQRPLNVLMLAQSGSGKSHFIRCLARSLAGPQNVGHVSFNMTALRTLDDLAQPLDAVRNLKVRDVLPLLFLDEIDCRGDNYSLLLPLLWDGRLNVAHRDLEIGKVIIILAASDPNLTVIMEQARNLKQHDVDGPMSRGPAAKFIDLLSRVNGGVLEIPPLDPEQVEEQGEGVADAVTDEDHGRRADKVCIALALLEQRFGPELELVPWALLHFVAMQRFRYGVRSIAHLTESIPRRTRPSDRLLLNQLDLPLTSSQKLKRSSLIYHLLAGRMSADPVGRWRQLIGCRALVRFKRQVGES